MVRCEINKDKREIEFTIEKMIERYISIKEELYKTSAITRDEIKERLDLMNERDFLSKYLYLFGIEDSEITSGWIKFKIND